jgi:hypothetical protein
MRREEKHLHEFSSLLTSLSYLNFYGLAITACAPASRASGTLNGEQDT